MRIFARVVLWLFVLSASILTGGSIFEHTVLTPLWAGSPPDSVTQWAYGSIQGKFFKVVTPFYFLFSVALIVGSRWLSRQQRKWTWAAGAAGIIAVLGTFIFFLPILGKTQATRGASLTGEEITNLVHQFKTWNWGRWLVLIGSWLAGLRALSLSSAERPAVERPKPDQS